MYVLLLNKSSWFLGLFNPKINTHLDKSSVKVAPSYSYY